ncbi:hypothetical protein GCM10007884_34820 [Methylobacterium brachythecii]|uniref:Uncharacterized protein n=1 Tax=Methylobacterium brachythecii TaxID=1176177 RepID=A0ABQ6D6Y8_9HYPH|nr:hypothetical protein GCM10007884_34820 [Methylobacterium brachythecii]
MAARERAGSHDDAFASLDDDAVTYAHGLDPLRRDMTSPGEDLQDFVRLEHGGAIGDRDVSASTLPFNPEKG